MQELAFSSVAPTPNSSRVERKRPTEPRSETRAPEPPPRVLPRRLGRYHLFAHIGRGGMADIHLAQADTGFGDATRLVVIKEMLQSYAESGEFAEMLVSEAKLAAGLSHANIVKVEDLGRAHGSLFIAMEYVEGLDLRELLRRCAKGKIALPVEFSLLVVVEALRGLSFAHRARDEHGKHLGIVHRDVSPSNVLLSFDGEVKLCDFGIARANALADNPSEDAIVGKAGYMSPEQARGDALDPRADVFAAGIILWELLAGRRLYRAAEGDRLLDAARAAVIPALPSHELPHQAELYAIVARALSADRDERYPSASAMLQDLEEYAAVSGLLASQLRFGEWLMENFGQEVVEERRARERALRALARGPVAVIQALPRAEASNEGGEPPGPAIPQSFLPDYDDETPSRFMVALRAKRVPGAANPADSVKMDPPARAAPVTPAQLARAVDVPAGVPSSTFDPHLFLSLFTLVGLVYLALRLVLVP